MPYLDHAAGTPMLPVAVAAATAAMAAFGNASSAHGAGREARRLVEESRETIAAALGAHPLEVVLTSGGTESANLAVKGLCWGSMAADPARRRVLVSAVEHPAVRDAAAWMAAGQGAVLEELPVDRLGRVHPETVADALRSGGGPGTVALVSVMWANNEVGTVQPVAEIAAVCERAGVPFHTDAVQAVGQVAVGLAVPGLTALSLTGHKFGGPPGAGVLLLRRGSRCVPLAHGGGQDPLRSGSLDPVGAAGLAAAVAEVTADLAGRAARFAGLRDGLLRGVREAVPDAVLNGDPDPAGRLPGNAHCALPGCDGDALLMLLDAAGVACSTGSACSAGAARASRVLTAMGVVDDLATASLRLTVGHTTTEADVAEFLRVLPEAVARARAAADVRTADVRTAASRPGSPR